MPTRPRSAPALGPHCGAEMERGLALCSGDRLCDRGEQTPAPPFSAALTRFSPNPVDFEPKADGVRACTHLEKELIQRSDPLPALLLVLQGSGLALGNTVYGPGPLPAGRPPEAHPGPRMPVSARSPSHSHKHAAFKI